jgi:hypothetical protein
LRAADRLNGFAATGDSNNNKVRKAFDRFRRKLTNMGRPDVGGLYPTPVSARPAAKLFSVYSNKHTG